MVSILFILLWSFLYAMNSTITTADHSLTELGFPFISARYIVGGYPCNTCGQMGEIKWASWANDFLFIVFLVGSNLLTLKLVFERLNRKNNKTQIV